MRVLLGLVVLLLPWVAGAAAPAEHNNLFSGRWFHAPVADDDCTVCHTMHRGPVDASLQESMPELCYQCHEDMAAQDVVHEPVGEGRCTDCHLVHTSEEPMLLIRRVPDLCIGCHPVNESHVGRGTLCTGCHGVHSSETSRFLKGNRSRNCGTCHGDKRRGETLHTPAREGKCLTCHFTHPDPRFVTEKLRGTYPRTPYAELTPNLYGLCDRCHDADLYRDPAYPMTWFRTGGKNLHYRHVAGGKGLTCSVCHDIHVARRPSLMVEWLRVPDQDQRLLQFLKFSTGGSCGPACHGTATYVRSEDEGFMENDR